MPKYCVTVAYGVFEIDDATDEGDAREQALDMAECDIEEINEEEDDDEEDEDVMGAKQLIEERRRRGRQ
jgi:hypothetical protein